MIDRLKYFLPPNYVLIHPDPDIETDRSGLKHHMFADAHLGKAVTGTVVAVCDTLMFYAGDDYERQQESIEFDTDIEVMAGDRVLYRYMATIDEEKQVDGMYLIRYDELYARIMGKLLYPLNGYIFVDPIDDQTTVAGIQAGHRELLASQTMGRVAAVGRPLRGYLNDPSMKDDAMPPVGSMAVYGKNKSVRIEVDEFSQYAGQNWSLYRIHNRHIKMILP